MAVIGCRYSQILYWSQYRQVSGNLYAYKLSNLANLSIISDLP